jgi:hypothetical protein
VIDDDEVEIDVVSEEEREWTDMIKGYLMLIQTVLSHSLASTLISQVRADLSISAPLCD